MCRPDAWNLVCEFVQSDSLRKHMLAVEAAMRRYARRLGEDEELWGVVGLVHDFDYELWPEPPDHTRQGAAILRQRGVDEEIIGAMFRTHRGTATSIRSIAHCAARCRPVMNCAAF